MRKTREFTRSAPSYISKESSRLFPSGAGTRDVLVKSRSVYAVHLDDFLSQTVITMCVRLSELTTFQEMDTVLSSWFTVMSVSSVSMNGFSGKWKHDCVFFAARFE